MIATMKSIAQSAADLLAPIIEAPPHRPCVVAQLGQSLDGRIATLTGDSQFINKDAALDHVHRLRSLVDAVVVGVGTVLADDPQLNVRRVPGRNPARVIIDPNARLPATARCLACDGARRYVVRTIAGPVPEGVELIKMAAEGGRVEPRTIVEMLFERGLRRILVEGGARTVSWFIDAGAVDRLHVLVAPLIIGSGKSGLTLAPIATLAEALRPATRAHVFADGDVLFDCDLRASS
jgi:diaminohydroxyphosphoribosylaminopyrimidine deaminase / 5-amino-6-(5-phosphoribosylamino)uracil reductase